MKVLFIQPVAEAGGSDFALLRMIRAFGAGADRSAPGSRVEAHVVLPGPGPLDEEFAAAGATVHRIPMRRITTSEGLSWWVRYALEWPVAVVRLWLLCRRLGIQIVHTNSLHSWYGWAAAALRRVPHVWHAREIVVQSGAALRLERFLTRHFATRLVCMSDAIAAQFHPGNVIIAWDEPDPTEFGPTRAGRFRASVGIPDDAPLAGSVGRIDTWKGVHVLLEAWASVAEALPHAHLAVVGPAVKGKEGFAAGLERRAAALPRAHWVGPRRDAPDVFADLDVFVLPSTEPEPFGLVVLEGLMSGAAAVVTADGGAQEIAARAPTSTIVVPRNDPQALAGAIITQLRAVTATSTAQRRDRSRRWQGEPFDFAACYEELLRA